MKEILSRETVDSWYNQLEAVREECGSWKALAEAQEEIIDEMMDNLNELSKQLPEGKVIIVGDELKTNMIHILLKELEDYMASHPAEYRTEILSKFELFAMLVDNKNIAAVKIRNTISELDCMTPLQKDIEDLKADLVVLEKRLFPR